MIRAPTAEDVTRYMLEHDCGRLEAVTAVSKQHRRDRVAQLRKQAETFTGDARGLLDGIVDMLETLVERGS